MKKFFNHRYIPIYGVFTKDADDHIYNESDTLLMVLYHGFITAFVIIVSTAALVIYFKY